MHGYGVCVALIVLALLAAAVSAGDGARIDVRSKRLSDVPISRLIFGNFIEAGFARQVPLMWAEMLYNRGFQEPVPYKSPMWDWIGFDPKHFNNKLPFWHSGYEEFDWELFGPTGTRKWRTLGTDTFKGNGSLVISVPDEGYGGIRQKGIYLHSGQTYDLAVFGRIGGDRNSDARRTVTVSLRWEGDAKPFFEKQVQFACFGEEHRLVVGPTAHAGRAVVEIGFAGKGELVLAWASMMPKETIHGWRPDVVKLLKRVAPPIIRFPGGCFASFSDWRQSVGPRAERQPIPSQYWGGLDDNDAGIDEFLDLCDEIGCEPQYCVNMMTSTPFKAAERRFRDGTVPRAQRSASQAPRALLGDGQRDRAQVVRYRIRPEGSRVRHGDAARRSQDQGDDGVLLVRRGVAAENAGHRRAIRGLRDPPRRLAGVRPQSAAGAARSQQEARARHPARQHRMAA
jgi:hypothetical protein